MAVETAIRQQGASNQPEFSSALLERLGRIDTLLDRVEEEVSERHNEAKNFGERGIANLPQWYH